MKTLIVDDSTIQRQFICASLHNHPIIKEFIEAENGIEAIKLLQKHKDIDLIITDYNMPLMNGLEVIKKVRSDNKLSHLPIIIISAEVKKENMLEAIVAGANMEILKPFTKTDLLKSIEYVLKVENKEPDHEDIGQLKIRIKQLQIENTELKKEIKRLKS